MSPLALRPQARRKARRASRAQEWLTRVGLGSFGPRYPHMLSGGQRKRVGLAQVLIRDPKILLMDEPFGPLDAQTRQIMGNLPARPVERRPQGGAVRHPRSRRGDCAVRPGGDHVGRPCGAGSSATGGYRCRGPATSPRSSPIRRFISFTARYGNR